MANDSSVHLGAAGNNFAGRIGAEDGEREIDLRQQFDLLKAGRWTIFLVAAGVFALALVYCLLVAPVYQADGSIQVEQSASKGGGSIGGAAQFGEISSMLFGATVETQAEIQVLRSRMILSQVVDKLKLQIYAQPKYFPLIGGAIFRMNHAATAPVSVPWPFRSFAWGGESIEVARLDVPGDYLGKKFTLIRTATGFSVDGPHGDHLLDGKVGEAISAQTPAGEFTIFVRDLQALPGTQFRLVRFSLQDVLALLSKKLLIAEQGKQSGVITVTYTGNFPLGVYEFINTLEDSYLRQNVERRSATAEQSLEYLQKQLPSLKEQLENAQLKLNAYQSTHGSVDVTEETQLALKQTVNLDSQRLQLQQQREELLQRFTAEHPAVKALDQQINSLDTAKGKVGQQVEKLPNTQQEIFSLMRDLDVSNELYTQMLNSIQELQVAKAGTVGNVRIVDRALEPIAPVSPKVKVVLPVALVLGVFLGMAVVLLQRALLRGVDDPAELESRLGLVSYAMVPFSMAQKRLHRDLGKKKAGEHSILAAVHGDDLSIEAIRSLRTSLHFALLEAANNVIMLTGPAPGLGKSFISMNLGAVLAISGKKAITVDADLRRGYFHTYISAAAAPGLSDYIAGSAEFSAVCHPSPIPGLDIIYRGTIPPNPAELLLHERFAELLKRLSAQYDYVIVDTPPVLAVTDAAIVGRLAGITLLVLKSAQHPLREIEEANKRLVTSGSVVKGVIFNQVGARAGSYGYGNYGYAYYRYDSES